MGIARGNVFCKNWLRPPLVEWMPNTNHNFGIGRSCSHTGIFHMKFTLRSFGYPRLRQAGLSDSLRMTTFAASVQFCTNPQLGCSIRDFSQRSAQLFLTAASL